MLKTLLDWFSISVHIISILTFSALYPTPYYSLAGGMIAGILQGRDTTSCVRMGLLAARLSLTSPHPISPSLTLDSIDPNKHQSWTNPIFMFID